MIPPLLMLGGGALALWLASKKSGSGSAATAKQTAVTGSWTDTSKPVPERMALALATQQPATILALAAELRGKGQTVQADSLTREANMIATMGVPSPLPQQSIRTASSAPSVASVPPSAVQAAVPTPAAGAGALDSSQVPDTLPTLGPGETLQYVSPPAPVDMRVAQWQKFLTAIGMNTGGVDGKFGPETQASTVAFQTAAGLTPSGIVDDATIAAAKQV
jgi:putative peptidoglycan binding protein